MTTFAVPLRILILTGLIWATPWAQGKSGTQYGFLNYHTENESLPDGTARSFILPNEDTPIKGKEVYAALKPGVLISVGTERGPIALTMAPQITHLLQLDRDPAVVIYNRVNILLLRAAARSPGPIAEKMKRYFLWKTTPQEILAALPEMKLSDAEKQVLRTITSSGWWIKIAESLKNHSFHSRLDRPREHDGKLQFVGVKYWRDADQAARLFAMADEGRIQAELVDLTDELTLQMVKEDLEARGLRVSGIDSSNVWFFAGAQLRTLARVFADDPDNLFIFTWLLGPRGQHYRLYTGMTFNALEKGGYMRTGEIQSTYESLVPLLKNGIIKSCDERLMSH